MIFNDFISKMILARTMSHYGPDFTDPVVQKAWYSKLGSLDERSLNRALSKLTGDREFPTINALSGFVAELNQPEDSSIDAFSTLWSAIRKYGSYNHPELPNEIGLAVEKLGGWVYICNNWTDDQRNWHHKQFEQVYNEITERKSMGIALTTSKYAPLALRTSEAKQIPNRAQEALRMAVSASEGLNKKSLVKRFKSIKGKQIQVP